MSKVADLHEKWSRDPAYRAAYPDFRNSGVLRMLTH